MVLVESSQLGVLADGNPSRKDTFFWTPRDERCTLLAAMSTFADPYQPASAPTRVLCVDDSPDMNDILSRLIRRDRTLKCVGCLESADDLIEAMDTSPERPDVVVLDATMNGRDPVQAMRELSVRYPQTRIIIFSGHEAPEFVDLVRGAGAWGCIAKNDVSDAIIRAIHDVAAGRKCFGGSHATGTSV
jgi:DNA-binding NarL/FixJ family response regulator